MIGKHQPFSAGDWREGLQRRPTQPQPSFNGAGAPRHGTTTSPRHNSTTVPQRPSTKAPKRERAEKHDRCSIAFLAWQWPRCCVGGAHATSASSTSWVEFAEVASATCSLGKISLRLCKRRPHERSQRLRARPRVLGQTLRAWPPRDREDF